MQHSDPFFCVSGLLKPPEYLWLLQTLIHRESKGTVFHEGPKKKSGVDMICTFLENTSRLAQGG